MLMVPSRVEKSAWFFPVNCNVQIHQWF